LSRVYKGQEIYVCLALNRLASSLNIDIHQEGLEEKLDDILQDHPGLPKSEISYEIRSNHVMTNKVITRLEEEGYVSIEKEGKVYSIRITKSGVLHLRQFNQFYAQIYSRFIEDHYRYRQLPVWYTRQ